MKINIEVDATPEEMRKFFGLPDVTELQQAAMDKMKEQMETMQQPFDLQQMMKAAFPDASNIPQNVNALGEMQKAFWEQFTKNKG